MAEQFQRGLFDVGITVLDDDGAPTGSLIHNFHPRSMSPTYQSDSTELQGNDARLEQFNFNERYEFTMETAGLPLDLLAALEGSSVVTTGADATLKDVVTKNMASNDRPFIQLTAQQKDRAGGATEFFFPKTQVTGSPTLPMSQGEYLTPQFPMVAVPATVADAGPPVVAVDDFYVVTRKAAYSALS
jgi:hypothetical protein